MVARGARLVGRGDGAWSGAGVAAVGAASDGRYKLIADVDHNLVELYDLERDPEERVDVSLEHEEVTLRLDKVLVSWQDLPGCRR